MTDPSSAVSGDRERLRERLLTVEASINDWMGLPDKNEARDKQRAILLLDSARDLLREAAAALTGAQVNVPPNGSTYDDPATWATAAPEAAALTGGPQQRCALGEYCRDHGFIHGAEAEELRSHIEAFIRERPDAPIHGLQAVLDDVDARDSLAWQEWVSKVTNAEGDSPDVQGALTGGPDRSEPIAYVNPDRSEPMAVLIVRWAREQGITCTLGQLNDLVQRLTGGPSPSPSLDVAGELRRLNQLIEAVIDGMVWNKQCDDEFRRRLRHLETALLPLDPPPVEGAQ